MGNSQGDVDALSRSGALMLTGDKIVLFSDHAAVREGLEGAKLAESAVENTNAST
jgi:hypothetical protein